MQNHDLTFLKKFSLIILFLVVVTVGLIALALAFHYSGDEATDPAITARVDARLAPYGGVYAGETGAAAQAAAQAAAAAAAASQVAYGGTLDGGVIYQNLCGACHTSGAGGAPKMERAAWADRLGQGIDTLTTHAIQGYDGPGEGVMPAKGGNPGLTDEQVQATVQWMVDNLQ